MIELTISDVRWGREQGHPVLVMSVKGELTAALSIVLSPGDAQMLTTKPVSGSGERLRLVGLIEGLASALGAKLTHVRFRLDPGMVLTADVVFEAGLRSISLPANFADAVVLAERASAPMLIGERDLRWIMALREPANAGGESQPPAESLTAAMNSFIESLQLDDLHGPRGDAAREP